MMKMPRYKVTIKLKKPYTSIYAFKPSKDAPIEDFADSLLTGEADDLLEIEVTEIKTLWFGVSLQNVNASDI